MALSTRVVKKRPLMIPASKATLASTIPGPPLAFEVDDVETAEAGQLDRQADRGKARQRRTHEEGREQPQREAPAELELIPHHDGT
jgi:hypothetical protein